jgi:hypothetical protein
MSTTKPSRGRRKRTRITRRKKTRRIKRMKIMIMKRRMPSGARRLFTHQ